MPIYRLTVTSRVVEMYELDAPNREAAIDTPLEHAELIESFTDEETTDCKEITYGQ